jgi:hypothetical protein
MNPNPEKKNDWLANKIPDAPAVKNEYQNESRSNEILSQWMVGYEDHEIAAFFSITQIEVAQDLQHRFGKMNARQLIAIQNDRERIRLYRTQSKNYSTMLEDGLKKKITEWFDAGLSPVPILKEYRQAVGMEEKPGGVAISVTKQSATFINRGGVNSANLGGNGDVKSFEDLLRMIIKADPTCALQPVTDIEAQELPPAQDDPDEEEEEELSPAEDRDETEDPSDAS